MSVRTNDRVPILYRWWDSSGRLLYVGKSISLFNRIAQHRAKSDFFGEAATMTIERFDTEAALAVAEIKAIRDEGPLYNVIGVVPGAEPRRIQIIVDDQPVNSEVGHWLPLGTDNLMVGQVIRWEADGYRYVGLVDDEDFDEPEFESDDGHFWYVITDTGETETIWNILLPLLNAEKWVSLDLGDTIRTEILDRYYEHIAFEAVSA